MDLINPKENKIYKIEYCLSAGANKTKKCLGSGKNAHMFTAFTFEDIKKSFNGCDENSDEGKKSLKWLKKKIDDNNKQNYADYWTISKIYENSSLTIPQLLVVYEDDRENFISQIKSSLSSADTITNNTVEDYFDKYDELIKHLKEEELGRFIAPEHITIFKNKETPLTYLKKIYELKDLWPIYSLKELYPAFNMNDLASYKGPGYDEIASHKHYDWFLDEFTFEELKPALKLFKTKDLLESKKYTTEELISAGFSLSDFANNKELQYVVGKNGERFHDDGLWAQHTGDKVFKLEDFKKVYGLRMLKFPGVSIEDMIDKLGFSLNDLVKSPVIRDFYDRSDNHKKLMKYILTEYNLKKLDYGTVEKYVKDLYINSGPNNWNHIPFKLLTDYNFFDEEPPPRVSGKWGIADFLITYSRMWIEASQSNDELGKSFKDYFDAILPDVESLYTKPLVNEAAGGPFIFKNDDQKFMGNRTDKLLPIDLNGDIFKPTKRQALYILDGNIRLQDALLEFIKDTLKNSRKNKESIEWLKVIIEESKEKELRNIDPKEIEKFLKYKDNIHNTLLFSKFKDKLIKYKSN